MLTGTIRGEYRSRWPFAQVFGDVVLGKKANFRLKIDECGKTKVP